MSFSQAERQKRIEEDLEREAEVQLHRELELERQQKVCMHMPSKVWDWYGSFAFPHLVCVSCVRPRLFVHYLSVLPTIFNFSTCLVLGSARLTGGASGAAQM